MSDASGKGDVTTIHIIHFNDVYNVEEKAPVEKNDPVGGAARFATAVKTLRSRAPDNTLTFFSGDLFSPSNLSLVTEGSHMVDVCNQLGVDCCVAGNHDFDFGVDKLMENSKRCTFPWLNANCFDTTTKTLLGELLPYMIIERGGLRFGIIGLVGPDWMDILCVVDQDALVMKDFCEVARALARLLRNKSKCDVIIALTHMRWAEDRRLAAEVPELDLILGGHDHDVGAEKIESSDGTLRWLIKSGTDFRHLSHIHLDICLDQRPILQKVSIDVHGIDLSWEPDPVLSDMVNEMMKNVEKKLDVVIGTVNRPLDGRFEKIRAEETNLGNFMADISLTSVDANCCILNSGSFRIDAVVPQGDLTLKQVSRIFPFVTNIVVLEVTGEELISVLESGVSNVPKLDGRFPQVSKIRFEYYANKPPGSRINRETIRIGKKPLDEKKIYRLATTAYAASGKDGYNILADKRRVVDEENAIPLDVSVVNYFKTIRILNGLIQPQSSHRQRLVTMKSKQKKMRTSKWICTETEEECTEENVKLLGAIVLEWQEKHITEKLKKAAHRGLSPLDRWGKVRDKLLEKEKKKIHVAPEVEGRIVRLDSN